MKLTFSLLSVVWRAAPDFSFIRSMNRELKQEEREKVSVFCPMQQIHHQKTLSSSLSGISISSTNPKLLLKGIKSRKE